MADKVVEMASRVNGTQADLQQQAESRKPSTEAPEMAGHGHIKTVRAARPLTQSRSRTR
jgi:hypothetical protein